MKGLKIFIPILCILFAPTTFAAVLTYPDIAGTMQRRNVDVYRRMAELEQQIAVLQQSLESMRMTLKSQHEMIQQLTGELLGTPAPESVDSSSGAYQQQEMDQFSSPEQQETEVSQ
jgi:hypothetical protein